MPKKVVRVTLIFWLSLVPNVGAGQVNQTTADTAAIAMGIDKLSTIQYAR